MKKLNLLLIFVISNLLLATACSNGPGFSENNTNYGANGTKAAKGTALTFNMGSLNALAIASNEDDRSAGRSAARNAATDGMIVKILEDGSIQNFINVPSNVELAPVSYIAQSPSPDAKEIYIVFNYRTWWGENVNGNWVNRSLGQLICVNEDGTYYDILEQEDDNNYKSLYNSSEDSIAFDEKGGMYYLVYEGNGNSNTNMIYKFDAKTGTSIQLTQAIPNTYYSKMQVSKDGNWIFAQAYRWTGNNSSDTRYLRAIPTSDPENSIPLFYSSTGNSWINDWCYDDDSKTMYYIQDSNMYAIPLKDGTFDKQNRVALFSSNNSSSLWFNYESLFKWDNNSVVTWTGCCSACDIDDEYGNNKYYYFRNPDSEKREIQPEQILKYLFAKAFDSFDYSITWSDWKKDYDDGKYEIRFDKFAEVEGYEALATLTKGKTDLSLIQTIIDDGLEELLYTLLNDNYDSGSDWYRCDQYFNNFYKHNFFADILYEKSTGKPISTDLFRKQTYGNSTLFYSNGIYIWNVLKSSYNNGYVWKDDFKKDKKVDAEKVLKELARYCGKSEIDFSLKCFKDDKTYGILYTDLTNKEAIEFLDTPARLSKLSTYFNDNWDSYNGAGKFLLETCFVKDTNFETPAYKWNKSSNDTIWWGCVSQLTPSYGESLYGVYSNGDGFGLIRIVDADGNKDGGYVASFSDYKVSDLISSTNGFYFKNSLLDENEEETGNHQIQYYDVIKDECTNLFENVTDNTELEVISFTAGDNCIYYCAAKGFSIINGKIDIGTKAATVLSTNTKLTQIIVIK